MVAYFHVQLRQRWLFKSNPDSKKVSALSGTNHKTTTTALENSCPLTPHRIWRATPPGFHHRTGLDYAHQTTLSKNIYRFIINLENIYFHRENTHQKVTEPQAYYDKNTKARLMNSRKLFHSAINYSLKLKKTFAVRRLLRGSVPKLSSERILAECSKQPR